ncbi:MAG: hypothetical protein AABX54_04415 [Nanoarchaeota archaeon]
MAKLNANQVGLTLGLFAALVHLIWLIAVAVGVQKLIDWVLLLHSIKLDLVLTNVVLLNAVLLIIIAFIGGYVVGAVFAWTWNYAGKCKWCK